MLNPKTLYVEEYEQSIPLFLINNQSGSVHSVFQNGLNILMNERLFFIGTVKNGKLPFGIHLNREAVQMLISSIHMPSSVCWDKENEQLIFENGHVIVSLKEGKPYSNIINECSKESIIPIQYLKTFVAVLAADGKTTGLDIDIGSFILDYLNVQKVANKKIITHSVHNKISTVKEVYRLMNALFSNDRKEVERVVRYFLGRGHGLTPSGDDHLVGLLAIHSISGAFSPIFLQIIKEIIEHESVTTDIGREYLFYALKGEFSSTIVNILNCLIENKRQSELEHHLIQLITVGHSSGVDTAFGLLIGLLLITNWRKSFMAEKVVIALGGNAILQPKQEATYENQLENVRKSSEIIARIVKNGHNVIITHGNGPQVGNILRQNEEAKKVVPPFPLDVCSAESQGFIGYMMDQTLKNELQKLNVNQSVVSMLTQTEVSKDDPAFQDPSKPIGVFFTEEEAKKLAEEKGWVVKEDAGRGWRRVVASPMPKSILGSDTIKQLTDANTIVISAGGGGIPVVRNEDGTLTGIEAVIDKDRSGFKLAEEVKADAFMILTDVQNVYVNYGKPEQKALTQISLEEAKQYVNEGQFSAGSMGPKMEAAIKFAELGGRAIICSLDQADLAMEGKAGTQITK